MVTQSHVAALQVDFAWNGSSFSPSGHVVSVGSFHIIPITVPLAVLALSVSGTTLQNPQEEPPGGFFLNPINDHLVYLNIANTNQGSSPQIVPISLETSAGTLEVQIANMSFARWQLSSAGRAQIGLAFLKGPALQPVGFSGDKLDLTSPFTAICLDLINTTWASDFNPAQMAGRVWYKLDGATDMTLVAFNANQLPEGELPLETSQGEPFTLKLANGKLSPPRDASVTVLQAILTFDSDTNTLVWSGDVQGNLLPDITTPFTIIEVTTVHTTFAPEQPICWQPKVNDECSPTPSAFYVQKVSDTKYYLYNLDAQLGAFAFGVKTTNGTADPTIVNKVPIQTDIDS